MTDTAGTAATGAAATGDQGAQGAADQQGQQQAAGTQAAATTAPPAGQTAPPAAAAPEAGAAPQGAAASLDWSQVPAEFRAAWEAENTRNHRLQQENGTKRINAKAEARNEGALNAVRDLAKSLGLELPGDEVTVESVQAELGTVTQRAEQAARQAALVDAAWQNDVDRAKQPYVEFLLAKDTSLPAPTDPTFAGKVSEAVAALVAADPTLRRSGTVAAAGVENHGGANGNDSISAEQFAAMSIGQRTELFNTDPDTYNRLSGRV